MKLIFHFLLAKRKTLAITRDSGNHKRGNHLENIFTWPSIPTDQQVERKGKGRKEGNGKDGKIYSPIQGNIPNKRQPVLRFAWAFLSRFFPDKKSIITRSKICQAQNFAKLSIPWNIPWNISSGRFNLGVSREHYAAGSPTWNISSARFNRTFQSHVSIASDVQVQVSCVRGGGGRPGGAARISVRLTSL